MELPNPPPPDPVTLVSEWLDAARRAGIQDNFNAMTLATVAESGQPSARVVLLKEVHPSGYGVFYTHYDSRKGEELAATGVAAGVMHWDPLGRQIRFEGPVIQSPAAESDRYFATRSWRSQINALVSEQSRPLTSENELSDRAQMIARQHGLELHGSEDQSVSLPRPPDWGGYRFWFRSIEFWVSGTDRFHDRVLYQRQLELSASGDAKPGHWQSQRLQP